MIYKNTRMARNVPVYYEGTELITYLGFPSMEIEASSKDTMYKVQPGDTLDTITYNFFGDTIYRWIIMYANPDLTTEFDITPGVVLRIPDTGSVSDYVNGIK